MSEYLEKLEQPELVVTPSVDVVADEGSTRSPVVAHGSESFPELVAAENAADTLAVVAAAAASRNNRLPGPTLPASKGLVRHQLITGCCVTLSLAILSLSAFDLHSLIEKKGTFGTNLKFTAVEKKDQLPSNYQYYDNYPTSDGMRPIRSANWSDDNLGYANVDGTVALPPIYSDIGWFKEGLAAVKIRGEKDPKTGAYLTKESQKWEYINKAGEVVLPAKYSDAKPFKNGVAAVAIDGHGALINTKGEIIANTRSNQAPIQFGDLYQSSREDYLTGLIDKNGIYVIQPIYDRVEALEEQNRETMRNHSHRVSPSNIRGTMTQSDISDNQVEYIRVWINGKCGLVSSTGATILPRKYDNVASFRNGHAVVLVKNSYGLVDVDGNFVIKPEYTFISTFDDIIAARDHNGDWKVFDSTGKLLKTQIDGAMVDRTSLWLEDGLAGVVVGNHCGFIDNKGNVVIKPEYDLVKPFSEGYGVVLKNGKWQYIDKAGRPISPITFSEVSSFTNGLAKVSATGILYDFIDSSKIDDRKYEAGRKRDDYKSGSGAS